MAINPKSLKNLKSVKKGQVLNPEGARAHSPITKALKNLTIETYREVIELALKSNIQELKRVAEDPKTPAVQVGVAVALMKAIRAGDWEVLERIAARIVGKIPDELNVHSKSLTKITAIDERKMAEALKELEDEI